MKKIALCFGLITLISVAQSFAPKQDRRFTLSLTEQEVNIVLQGLGKLPLETAQPVYGNIMEQANAQIKYYLNSQNSSQKKDSINKKKP